MECKSESQQNSDNVVKPSIQETAQTLNTLPEHIPIIIKSYIELHNGWVTRKRPIDLIEVFRYREDTLENPYIGADIALQCEGRRILLTKPNWVSSLGK